MKVISLNYIKMSINLIKQIQKAIKPLVALFLRFGFGYKKFDEIVKEVFVSVATDNYGIRGREANTSKIAFMTGISRREISNIKKNKTQEENTNFGRLSYSERILDIWLNHKDFANSKNKPKAIMFEGTGNSFVELIRKAKIDITPKTAYLELLRLELIGRNEKDQIILQRYELIGQSKKELFAAELEKIIDNK